MASTYSSYKIELIGTGEQSGTWGATTNNNFQYAIEQAIGGYATQALTTTSTSLTLSDTNALQNARALFLQFTGTPGSGATVVLPSIQKLYFIKNSITTYDLIVKTSVVPSGTYGRSGNTVTVTVATTSTYSTGQTVNLTFSAGTGGTATNGNYQITVINSTQFTVTDSASGTITGSPNVDIADIVIPNGKTACVYVNGTQVIGTANWLPSLTTTSINASGSATISGNFSSGTVVTTSGTYSRSGTTVTVTSAAHGFSTGQNLYLVFTTGAATTGVYSITVVDANTFTVTDSVSGTTSGNVTINRYTNTVTFLAPVSSFGSFGTTGQVLSSQGVNIPPQWTTLASVSGNWTVGGNLSVTGTSTFNGAATFNGNTTVGSITSSTGTATYTKTSTTINVTVSGGTDLSTLFSNGNVVYIVTSTGDAPSGLYTISSLVGVTGGGAFTGTPVFSSFPTTTTGGNITSITKYNNTATLQAPLSSFGSAGSSGYLLASQGASAPPQWVNGVSKLTNSTDKLSVDSSGNLTAVVPSGSTLLPAFLPRAWVNFDGTTAANVSGTYSQSGTTVTATITGHGLIPGNIIYVDITSGTGVDGAYTVATVTDANTFTYTAGTSLTTSGNITLNRRLIRGSGNVSNIAAITTGDYVINFNVSMPDANYLVAGSASNTNGAQASSVMVALASASSYLNKTSSAVRIYVTDQDVVGFNSGFDVNVIVIR